MAKYSANVPTYSSVGVADTSNFTDAQYIAIQGGAAAARTAISEVYVGGQATSSAPQYILVARDSTVGATGLTGVRTAALDASAAGNTTPTIAFSTTTTKPQRSATLSLLNLSFNAFGGIVRWVAAPGSELFLVGATASLGEISISAAAASTTGPVGTHAIYEQV